MKKSKAIKQMQATNFLQFFNKHDWLFYHAVKGKLMKTDNTESVTSDGPDYYNAIEANMPKKGYVKLNYNDWNKTADEIQK